QRNVHGQSVDAASEQRLQRAVAVFRNDDVLAPDGDTAKRLLIAIVGRPVRIADRSERLQARFGIQAEQFGMPVGGKGRRADAMRGLRVAGSELADTVLMQVYAGRRLG